MSAQPHPQGEPGAEARAAASWIVAKWVTKHDYYFQTSDLIDEVAAALEAKQQEIDECSKRRLHNEREFHLAMNRAHLAEQERDTLAQQLAEANEENRLLKLAGAITDCLNESKRTKSPYHRANANTESLEMDNDFPDDELPNK